MRIDERSSIAAASACGHQGAQRRHPRQLRNWRAAAAVASLSAAALIIGPSVAASAAGGSHTQTLTQTFHGSQPFSNVNPCTGNLLDGTESSNIIAHETLFPAGDELWMTFTEEDNFSAADVITGVTYTGHATGWDNVNLNQQNANTTATFSAHATGSDGSTISLQEVVHITMVPGGTISVSFDKPSLTCG